MTGREGKETVKQLMKKIILSLGLLLAFAAAMFILKHPAQNGYETIEYLPEIVTDPVYVECEEGVPLEVSLEALQDMRISSLELFMVNISEENRGTVQISLLDQEGNLLLNEGVPIESISPGKWFSLSCDLFLQTGKTYQLTILPEGGEPYFMQVPEGGSDKLPFHMQVSKRGQMAESEISLGVHVLTEKKITYGDIFYYSVPVCVAAALFLLCLLWIGKERMLTAFRRLPLKSFLERFGNDLFLLLLFGMICLGIYVRAYQKGVYISADSAGYLREAVALSKGQGFSYDGLSGYESWFANWPIVYPALIAGMMLLTGANAYLASKFLTMVLVGLLLLVLRLAYQKDAWIYGLCLTNIGFLALCDYTWSEVPFMLFLLCFGLALSRIWNREQPKWGDYVFLCVSGTFVFLTRYFGIYIWIVTGCLILYLLWQYYRKREKNTLIKAFSMAGAGLLSGGVSMAYLLWNKRMNGMASGVSRTMWWDDYEKLTNDLIESLLTEVCNVFSIQIPEFVEQLSYELKVLIVVAILVLIGSLLYRKCRLKSRAGVFAILAAAYYGIFIVIRYFSSMDSFYFRFFEPASFLLCLSLIELILPGMKGKKGLRRFAAFAAILAGVCLISEAGQLRETEECYYEKLAEKWDSDYEEIPQKSVIIFNDIDFRSSWYRPDVIEGTIRPENTWEEIASTYYGSEYLCIRADFAKAMLESGEYDASVAEKLENGLEIAGEEKKFVVVALKG